MLDLGAPFSSLPGVSMTIDRVSLSRHGHVLGTGSRRGPEVTLETNEGRFLGPPGGDPPIVPGYLDHVLSKRVEQPEGVERPDHQAFSPILSID